MGIESGSEQERKKETKSALAGVRVYDGFVDALHAVYMYIGATGVNAKGGWNNDSFGRNPRYEVVALEFGIFFNI